MLNRTATIIVPTRDRAGAPLPGGMVHAHMVACQLTRMFGGATITDGYGYWTDASGRVVDERVAYVTAYTDDAGAEKNFGAVGTFAAGLCLSLRQDAVAFILDGTMYFAREDDPDPGAFG